MSTLEEQVADTWRIHQRIMMFMIGALPDAALSATLSTRGGRDIARQLAHAHNVRAMRLESFAKKQALPLYQFDKDESPAKEKLLEAFEQSGAAMEQYILFALGNDGQVSNFKRGVVPMIGYYISHEAHHRGHLYLTMKQCGIKMPDELRWGIWEWNKI
ncbi:MAG: hypothetical protein KDC61_15545 [Saprospiraceae bacterium]|nr:hypothetical protein [Saprospiraceae bacterium]MCB9356831.1 hypothetical protein [Lewinellaceae bacterium]